MVRWVSAAGLSGIAVFFAVAPVYATGMHTPPERDEAGMLVPGLRQPTVPLEAFFSEPDFDQPQLSPDGRSLAVLHRDRDSGALNLVLVDLSTRRPRHLTEYTTHRVAWFVWVDDNRIAYRAEPLDAALPSREWFNLVRVSRSRIVTTRYAARDSDQKHLWESMRLLDPRPLDGGHLLVTVSNGVGAREVATVDVGTGKLLRLSENPGDVLQWVVDRAGRVRVAVTLDEDLVTRLLHRDRAQDPWVAIHRFEYGQPGIWPLAFTTDPDLIYVLSDIGRDTRALHLYNLKTRQLEQQLFAHDQVDVSGLVLSRDGKWAIGARYETDRARIHYFDPYRAAIDTDLANALWEYEVEVQFSDDGQTALVTAHNERNPGRYYHFDANSGRLRELFSRRDFLPEQFLSTTRPIDFVARDGERIHGFLTMPRGVSGDAPTVVLVHGGPHEVRDSWGFDPEVQFLANRGYSVLQVNFRGSSGYGRRFQQLGWGGWGEGIQDDIADAVLWATRQGYIDSQRVCIYGWSFGGYSALMSMARNPDLYRCGISVGGVTDLSLLTARHSPVETSRQTYLDHVLGGDDQVALAMSSPINRIDDIQAPVLIAHGLNDSIVPVVHFERFVKALAIYDKPGEGLLLQGQGHGLSSEQARFDFYRQLERFLDENLGSGAATGQPFSGAGVQPRGRPRG